METKLDCLTTCNYSFCHFLWCDYSWFCDCVWGKFLLISLWKWYFLSQGRASSGNQHGLIFKWWVEEKGALRKAEMHSERFQRKDWPAIEISIWISNAFSNYLTCQLEGGLAKKSLVQFSRGIIRFRKTK